MDVCNQAKYYAALKHIVGELALEVALRLISCKNFLQRSEAVLGSGYDSMANV